MAARQSQCPGTTAFLPQRFTGVSTTTRVSNGQTWGKCIWGGLIQVSPKHGWEGERTTLAVKQRRVRHERDAEFVMACMGTSSEQLRPRPKAGL